jgi:hypothetical protein
MESGTVAEKRTQIDTVEVRIITVFLRHGRLAMGCEKARDGSAWTDPIDAWAGTENFIGDQLNKPQSAYANGGDWFESFAEAIHARNGHNQSRPGLASR